MGKRKTEMIGVKGMFCTNCEQRVQKGLLALPGVVKARASFEKETVALVYDEAVINPERCRQAIRELGYEPVPESGRAVQTASILIIILALYVIADRLGWTEIFNLFPSIDTSVSLGILFFIGLLTSVHCIAMCGGINLAQSTAAAKGSGSIGRANLAYNAGRVLSYTAIGGIVGGIGSVLSFTGAMRGMIAVFAGAVMILMALSMLGIFRPLRRLPLHLPAGLYGRAGRIFRGRSSLIVGFLNGCMPCGPLQSMQIYALSAGSAAKGALSMLLFSLGTVPLMLGFGLFSGRLNRKYARYMLTVSAFLIFLMGIHMAGNGLSLSGVSVLPAARNTVKMAETENGTQYVTTQVDYGAYESFLVRRDIPVEWTIEVPEGKLNGCNGEILVPAFGLDIKLSEGKNVVTFTPTEKGTVLYSCWMGMIQGSIEITD